MRCAVGIVAHVSSELFVFFFLSCGNNASIAPLRRASALDFSAMDTGGAFFGAKTPVVEAVFRLGLVVFIPVVLRMSSSAWCLTL